MMAKERIRPIVICLFGRDGRIMQCTVYGTIPVMDPNAILNVLVYRTEGRKEPVREWLRTLDTEDRKVIGEDVKLVQ